MSTDRTSQQSAACISCHVIGVSAASVLGIYMFYRAKKADSTTHRFTCAIFGLDNLSQLSLMASATSSTNEFDLIAENTSDKRSLIKTLIRYVMHTFYPVPASLIVEYIYHYECINLEELARLLLLNPRKIQSHVEQFKRDKIIIEEDRTESNSGVNRTFDPSTLYYRIDLVLLVNVIKYRLIKMQFEIEDFEREESSQPMPFKCEQCSQKYTEWDIANLMKTSAEEDLKCTQCPGIISENNSTEEEEEESVKCTLSLYNHQMTQIFQILEKIDEIMKNEEATMVNSNIEVSTEKNDESDITIMKERVQEKSLPEWFVRSINSPHSNQSNS